jgi:hypothetical protein
MITGNHKINCKSHYFELKYGKDTIIEIQQEMNFRGSFAPPAFLYLGRALAEGNPFLLEGKTYYGKINGLGEYVHESEIGGEI